MPIFVALGRATDDGVRNLEGFALRHKRAVERAEKRGVKMLASYAVMGPYDYVVILESPDAKTALRVLSIEASGGNVRYETYPAFTIEEFAEIVMP